MPSYKIKQMLTYKALWEEVPVIPLNKAYPSKMCWRCGSLNTEIRKRCFRCKDCGSEYNQDLNEAINIENSLLGYMLKNRASVNTPKTSPENTTPKKGDLITFQSAREEASFKSWE